MVVQIPLSRGQVALVDDADVALLSERKWYAKPIQRVTGGFYASQSVINPSTRRGTTIYLHRVILGALNGQCVDHINGDGLDNRRENIRIATISLNNANRTYASGVSGFRGVQTHRRQFRAFLGRTPNHWRGPLRILVRDAALDYDYEANRRFGAFARLNFPEITQRFAIANVRLDVVPREGWDELLRELAP